MKIRMPANIMDLNKLDDDELIWILQEGGLERYSKIFDKWIWGELTKKEISFIASILFKRLLVNQ